MNATEATGLSGAADTWPYSAREAATILGVSERTIRRAVARGDLLATKRAGVFRISPAALEAYRADHHRQRRVGTGSTPSDPSRETRQAPHQLHVVEQLRGPAFDLPHPVTSFLGRTGDVAAVLDHLGQPATRLLTLTGPGGVGKTRLALWLAHHLAARYDGGVAFMPLAPVADAALVPDSLAQALGVREHAQRSVPWRLAAALHGQELFLILDNFEHVLPAAPMVAELLAACRGLTVLVTSRSAINISGEHTFPVLPLALPAREETPTAASVSQVAAVQLFVTRAQAAVSGFILTDEDAEAVSEICRCLDGVPLAIELAAARVPVLPPRALLARLDRQLELLTDGPQDAPPRLRAMRDAIAWSHGLLSPEARLLFRRLAVFAGGGTLEALDAVVGDDLNVLAATTALVSSSLLRQEETLAGEPRFLMLETIRQFAWEQLEASGEVSQTRQRHAAYYLALVEHWSPDPPMPGEKRHLAVLSPEYDNIRLALAWFDDQRDADGLMRLAGALFEFWFSRALFTEGRQWLRRALALAENVAPVVHLRALSAAGGLAVMQRDHVAAGPLSAAALPLARELGDADRLLSPLIIAAIVAGSEQGLDAAEALMEEAYQLASSLGPDDRAAVRLAGVTAGNLGAIARGQGRLDRSAAWCMTAIARLRSSHYAWALIDPLALLGVIRGTQGNLEEAVALTAEALDLAVATGDPNAVADGLYGVAGVASTCGIHVLSVRLLGSIEGIKQRLGISFRNTADVFHGRWRAAATAAVGECRVAEEMAAGRAMTIEAAVDTARQVLAAVDRRRPVAPALAGLTPRECDVLRLVMAGQTDREIGDILFLSRRTINAHVGRILAKLEARTRREATAKGHALGLLPDRRPNPPT